MVDLEGRHWSIAHCFIGNVIATLLDMNWSPYFPYAWKDDQGNVWTLEGSICDKRPFMTEIIHASRKVQWANAAKAWNGTELENGPDLTAVRRYLKHLATKGEHRLAGLGRCIIAGGIWTRERSYASGSPVTTVCPLCNASQDNEFHRYWDTCPVIMRAKHPHIVKSQHLVQRAQKWASIDPCLWYRA